MSLFDHQGFRARKEGKGGGGGGGRGGGGASPALYPSLNFWSLYQAVAL